MKRPIGVTILAFIAGFMAIIMALAALQWLGLIPWFGPGPAVRTFNLWYALMYGLLAYIYFWLTQMLWRLDGSAWLFLAVITVFNLILNFVSLISGTPWEWVAVPILLNTLVLIYIMLPGVRQAFGQEQSTPADEVADAPAEEAADEAADEAAEEAAEEPSDEADSAQAELEKLADLHDQGILTDEEYQAKKDQLEG